MQTSQTVYLSQTTISNQKKSHSEPAYFVTLSTLIFAGLWGLTAFVGLWAAYDLQVALIRLVTIGIGLGLFVGIPLSCRENTRVRLSLVGVGCSWLAGLLGILLWFVQSESASGALAGSISVLLPLGLSGAGYYWLQRRHLFSVAAAPLVVALVGLLLSWEHSAWLSTLAGLIGSATFFRLSRHGKQGPTNWAFGLIVVGLAVLACVGLGLLLRSPALVILLARLPLGDSAISRVDLWQNTLTLIGDYPFTGSGLGVSSMVYSTYIYLLHVPYFYHAHELFLQIAVEQGLPGLVAFLGLLLTTLYGLLATNTWRNSRTLRLLYSTSFGSLLAFVVYGLLDAEAYVQVTLPLLLIPFGFALALQGRVIRVLGMHRSAQMQWDSWLPLGVPWLALVSMMVWPGAFAAMQADLGAVAQTKAELSVYHWPEWKIQDDLRRQGVVNLERATLHYQSALGVDPNNDTAYRRLGQVALSEGNIERAESHLRHAYTLNPQDRATRQLLGEIYAISGKINEAVALWQTIDIGQGQLDVRHWWYTYIGADEKAALFAKAIQRLKGEQVASE